MQSAFEATMIETIDLPELPIVSNATYLFNACIQLKNITLPELNVTSLLSAFSACNNLKTVTLPNLNSVTTATNMFYNCYGLDTINNVENLGSKTDDVAMSNILFYGLSIKSLSIEAKLTQFEVFGYSTYSSKITSLRLTNTGSLFTGTAPQIDISYTDLNDTAINQVFTDLPTLVSKTINISGASGSATCDRSIATGKGWTVTG